MPVPEGHIAGTYNLQLLFLGFSVLRFTVGPGQGWRPKARR